MILSAILFSCAVAQAAPAAASEPTTVILVRHAEKLDEPKDPSLSPAGKARADALVDALGDLTVGAVIVSDTKRARETAAPLAAKLGLTPIEVSVAQGGEAHIKGVVAAVRAAPRGSTVVVVGHSNTLAPVIAALGGPEVPALCEKQYAPMFVLELADGAAPRLERKSYGASDPPGAEKCAQ